MILTPSLSKKAMKKMDEEGISTLTITTKTLLLKQEH